MALHVVLAGLGLFALGITACSGPRCDTLCDQVRRCRADVSAALVGRLPSASPFLRHVRARIPGQLVPRLLASCPQRCAKLKESYRRRLLLERCLPKKDCAAFARCIAPALEP